MAAEYSINSSAMLAQVQGMTQEEVETLFPNLVQEQDWQMPAIPAPHATTSAPQQQGSLQPTGQAAGKHCHALPTHFRAHSTSL